MNNRGWGAVGLGSTAAAPASEGTVLDRDGPFLIPIQDAKHDAVSPLQITTLRAHLGEFRLHCLLDGRDSLISFMSEASGSSLLPTYPYLRNKPQLQYCARLFRTSD